MIFVRSIIENFFSISDQIVIEMENQGLILVAGENQDSQAASSNGSGKSAAIMESIPWCLWGKTARGLSGDAIVNRKVGKDCFISILIRHNNSIFQITRYRKHTKHGNNLEFAQVTKDGGIVQDLTQGTTILTQNKINSFLGIDYETFIQGPMIPQGHFKRFSEMTDSEQKAIFERALQIEVLAEAEKETKTRISQISNQLALSQTEYNSVIEQINKLKIQAQSYETEKANWSNQKRQSLVDLAKQIFTAVDEQEAVWERAQASNYDQSISDSKAAISQLRQSRDTFQKQWMLTKSELQNQLSEVRAEYKELTVQTRNLQTEIRNMQNLSGAVCPTCGQEVLEEHVSTCLDSSKEELSKKTKKSTELAAKIQAFEDLIQKEESKYNESYQEILNKINDSESKYMKILDESSKSKTWTHELFSSQKQEETLRQVFKKKQEEKTPFDSMISDINKNIVAKQKSLVIVSSLVKKYQLELEHLEFWQYGFSNKGLKSHILASVTPFLNERVQHYTKALSGDELSIEFSTQTTLKSGETREKFSVSVKNKNGADSYIGNSGGEKSRADLAINFVLSDLMASRSKRPYPQRFLDEPIEALDDVGIESVMELLQNMASESGSIFVVTHQDSMKGLFNKTIKLIKKDGQTTLESN